MTNLTRLPPSPAEFTGDEWQAISPRGAAASIKEMRSRFATHQPDSNIQQDTVNEIVATCIESQVTF